MDQHPRLIGFNLFCTDPRAMKYFQGLGQVRTMVNYHFARIAVLGSSDHVGRMVEAADRSRPIPSDAYRRHDKWIDEMRAEITAAALLLPPQMEGLAQALNYEALHGAFDPNRRKTSARSIANRLNSEGLPSLAQPLIQCLDDDAYSRLTRFVNMIKHAPAMGFTHEAGQPIGGGPIAQDWYFRPYDQARGIGIFSLGGLREAKAAIDSALTQLGDALAAFQIERGRLVDVPERRA